MKSWITAYLVTITFSAFVFSPSHANAVEDQKGADARQDAPEDIWGSACFGQEDLGAGVETLVGRLVLYRQFMGTREDPMYHDSIRFRFFDGSKLQSLTIPNDELKQPLLDQLHSGQSLPAVLTVEFERVRVGHDGINFRERLVPRVQTYLPTDVEVVCAAARKAGIEQSVCDAFTQTVKPDVMKDGIAVSLDQVFVRPRILPNWKTSSVSINGIRVFNTTVEDATIEIVGLDIEQAGVRQACLLNEKLSLRSWQVSAKSWSDGVYTKRKMPYKRWVFDPAKSIDPDKPVTIYLDVKINGGEPVRITRTVTPMSLKK